MNKLFITFVAACLFGVAVPAKALIPILSDAAQFSQKVLMDAQNVLSTAQAYVKAANAYRTMILKGYAGYLKITDVNRWKNLFATKLDEQTDKIVNTIGKDVGSVLGDDVAAMITDGDLDGIDLDSIKKLGEKKLTALTEQELKNILGESLANKIGPDQIKAIAKDPKNAMNLLKSLSSSAQQQQKQKNGLEGLGLKGNALADQTKTEGRGADGNRSDAFNGSGNGSTAQAAASVKAFEESRAKIEQNVQLPKTKAELDAMTPKQLYQISVLQTEAVKELSVRGLSKAWTRQAITKNRNENQELVIKNISDTLATGPEGKNVRNIIKLATTASMMTVESQNNMSEMFASALSAYAAQVNRRTGSSSTPVILDDKAQQAATNNAHPTQPIDPTAAKDGEISNAETIFKTILERITTVWQNLRTVIYVLGGFGLIGFAYAATFNKLSWSWFAALCVGLLTVSLLGAIINYVTAPSEQTTFSPGSFGDTLTQK